jgi:hypothetical protein
MCGHHYIQTNTNNVKKNVVFLFHFVIRIHLNVFQLYIYIYFIWKSTPLQRGQPLPG